MDEAYKLIDDFNALTEDAQTMVADYVIDRASSSALRDELRKRVEYEQLKGKCRILWESFSPDKQDYIYSRIEEKKKRKEFVDYNPKFAIEKNSSAPRQQTMSYADYYSLYGTTEERDGWKMVNPTGNKVIYVKGGPG